MQRRKTSRCMVALTDSQSPHAPSFFLFFLTPAGSSASHPTCLPCSFLHRSLHPSRPPATVGVCSSATRTVQAGGSPCAPFRRVEGAGVDCASTRSHVRGGCFTAGAWRRGILVTVGLGFTRQGGVKGSGDSVGTLWLVAAMLRLQHEFMAGFRLTHARTTPTLPLLSPLMVAASLPHSRAHVPCVQWAGPRLF